MNGLIPIACTILVSIVTLPIAHAEDRAKPIPVEPAKAIKVQTQKAKPINVNPAKSVAAQKSQARRRL